MENIDYGVVLGGILKSIHKDCIDILHHPIVSLKNRTVAGYEISAALSQHLDTGIEHILLKAISKDKMMQIQFLLDLFSGFHMIRKKDNPFSIYIKMDITLLQDQPFLNFIHSFLLGRKKISKLGFIIEVGTKLDLENLSQLFHRVKVLEKNPCFLRMPYMHNSVSLLPIFAQIQKLTNIPIVISEISSLEYNSLFLSHDIRYAMGHLLGEEEFVENEVIQEEIEEEIEEGLEYLQNTSYSGIKGVEGPIYIGNIVEDIEVIDAQVLGEKVKNLFEEDTFIEGIPVLSDQKPIGLVMRTQFYKNLSTQYGYSIFMKRPIDRIMDKNPLIIDYFTPISEVSEIAMARPRENLYDYIIVTKNKKYKGIVTIKNLLITTSQIQVSIARYANPLTGLPGNVVIEDKLTEVIKKKSYSVLYFDLDNFKAYNDVYGFENGDKIIRATANILNKNVQAYGREQAFLGHIGGDDFIGVFPSYDIEEVCEKIVEEFNQQIQSFYNEKDRARGYIFAKNRHGDKEKFPFMSLSIAVVTNKKMQFSNIEDLAKAAVELKKECKMCWESCYKIL